MRLSTDGRRLLDWEAGYPRREAHELSELPDLDLHLAVRLLERGCTVETTLQILL